MAVGLSITTCSLHRQTCGVADPRLSERYDAREELGLISVKCQTGMVQRNEYAIAWTQVYKIVYPHRTLDQNDPAQAHFDPATDQNDPARSMGMPRVRVEQNGLPNLPSSPIGDDELKKEIFDLVKSLWPAGRSRIKDWRDNRLLYAVAVLRLTPEHAEWIGHAVQETVQAKAKAPLGKLNKAIDANIPKAMGRYDLLRSINVPKWALADPRLV